MNSTQVSLADFTEIEISPEKWANLFDLPAELLLSIYKNLDVSELVTVSQSHPWNFKMARAVFRDKYSTKKVTISGRMNRIMSTDHYVAISGIETILSTLQLFGDLISDLEIGYNDVNSEERKIINQQVNRLCAQHLREFKLSDCRTEDLVDLPGPFPKVEIFRIEYSFLDNSNIQLNAVYPALRHIELTHVFYYNSKIIVQNLAHLEQLSVSIYPNGNFTPTEQMLELNPQLRAMTLSVVCYLDTLNIINRNVPQLEHLGITVARLFYVFEDGQFVHFEHLKTLKFKENYEATHRRTIPLVCTTLEEFEYLGSIDHWLKFIFQNKQLKKLTIGEVNDAQLLQIAEKLPLLQQLSISFDCTENSIESFANFVNKTKSLRSISFQDKQPLGEIAGLLTAKWHIDGQTLIYSDE